MRDSSHEIFPPPADRRPFCSRARRSTWSSPSQPSGRGAKHGQYTADMAIQPSSQTAMPSRPLRFLRTCDQRPVASASPAAPAARCSPIAKPPSVVRECAQFSLSRRRRTRKNSPQQSPKALSKQTELKATIPLPRCNEFPEI